MSFDYEQSAATADRLIERFGAAVVMSRTVLGAYDPALGGPAAGSATTQGVKAAVFDFPQSYIDGTLIRAGDRKALVSVVGIAAPQPGDTFPWLGQTLVVVSVKTLGPAGVAVLYTLQVRTV